MRPPNSMSESTDTLKSLLRDVRRCTLCHDLPLGPKPLLQCKRSARILIAGQAPGKRTHQAGIPFDDVSGNRLRDWLGVDRDTFYDASRIAILPIGFCYPGTGKSGDLPPRKECAPAWREQLLEQLPEVKLTILIGMYAQRWHLGASGERTLTANVINWQSHWPTMMPLPHPSPRNTAWLARHPFVEKEMLPALRKRVAELTN